MKIFIGKVILAKANKTAVVEVRRQKIHPLYKKRLWINKRYPVHDTIGLKAGDLVKFKETRPISKTKKWEIIEVIK